MILALTIAAYAQGLSLVEETTAPFHPSGSLLGPIDEGGALVFFGRDIETQTPRSMQLTASGATFGPGLPPTTLSVQRCGGERWTLEIDEHATHYRVLGTELSWSLRVPSGVVPNISVGCAKDKPFVAWVEAGVLTVQPLGTIPGVAPFQTQLWSASSQGHLHIAALGETFFALTSPWETSPALLRIVDGKITHRRDLDRVDPTGLVLAHDQAIVAASAPDRSAHLQSFALEDLAPAPVVRTPPAMPGGQLSVASMVPGPQGLVAVQLTESWIGDDFVAISQGPDEPDRYEPAYHFAASLRLFMPETGVLGPPTALQRRSAGACGWIGEQLALVQVVESAGVSGGIVQLHPALVRRYALTH